MVVAARAIRRQAGNRIQRNVVPAMGLAIRARMPSYVCVRRSESWQPRDPSGRGIFAWLVTIPIRLVSTAASEDKIALHQVDRKSKQRIRYQKIAGETGKVVPQTDIVQGYELDDGTCVLFEADEVDKLKLTTRHTVELTEFVDACSIDPLYFDNPYYVLPDGDVAEEGYRIIRDALKAAKKYGVGQLTMRGRENLIAMKPCGDGLTLETLHYESEVRDAGEASPASARVSCIPSWSRWQSS